MIITGYISEYTHQAFTVDLKLDDQTLHELMMLGLAEKQEDTYLPLTEEMNEN